MSKDAVFIYYTDSMGSDQNSLETLRMIESIRDEFKAHEIRVNDKIDSKMTDISRDVSAQLPKSTFWKTLSTCVTIAIVSVGFLFSQISAQSAQLQTYKDDIFEEMKEQGEQIARMSAMVESIKERFDRIEVIR